MAQELGISEKDPDFHNPFQVDRAEVSGGRRAGVSVAQLGPRGQNLGSKLGDQICSRSLVLLIRP